MRSTNPVIDCALEDYPATVAHVLSEAVQAEVKFHCKITIDFDG